MVFKKHFLRWFESARRQSDDTLSFETGSIWLNSRRKVLMTFTPRFSDKNLSLASSALRQSINLCSDESNPTKHHCTCAKSINRELCPVRFVGFYCQTYC